MEEIIINKIFELSDNEYKKFHSNLCPGTDNIVGVRVPVLRNYAKELIRQYPLNELLNNIGDNYYEEIMLKGMLIGLAKNENIDLILKYVKEFVPKIDNWAICDTFCAGLKITNKNNTKMLEFIKNYKTSKSEFEVRFFIVMLLDYYIDDEHIDYVLKNLNTIKTDEYYVQMAVAWCVSVCIVKYYDKSVKFLQNCNLDKITYNKSLQKAIESFRISDEQKSYLRNLKK